MLLTDLESELLDLLRRVYPACSTGGKILIGASVELLLADEAERQRLAALLPIPDDEIENHYKPRR